ncbi:MAG: apolipoprotein N-acyltransferase [Candidatus Marinimicrobia bacterium]|nr:apolipoprotein N-acyltransferase [Candidatus Neomarinimicrobiota bacterium]
MIYIFFSGLVTGISQQPLSLGFLCWLSLYPIFYYLEDKTNYKYFFKAGVVWGITYHITTIFWLSMNIGTNTFLAFLTMFLSALVLSFNTIVIFTLIYFFKRKYVNNYLLFFPLIWVVVEYVKSFGVLGFPWVSLANTQTDYLILIQNAEILGIYGITFWIVFVNVIFYKLISSLENVNVKNNINFYILILIIIVPWFTGYQLYIKNNYQSDKISVKLVQPNISLKQKWMGNPVENLNKIITMSIDSSDKNIDLIIWPESALPAYFLNQGSNQVKKIRRMLGPNTKLVSGTTNFDRKNDKVYNSVVYLDKKNDFQYYNKIQLVPMAEYVPWSNIFSFLRDLNLGQANFSKGKDVNIFNYDRYRFGSVVCYESTFPWLFNEFVRNGSEFMIIVTNDGWYETAPEPQQHAKQSIFRAIENRKPIIRCANTGISMIIDSKGNIEHKLELNKKGIINASIIPNKNITFYNKFGDYLILFMGFVLLFSLLIKKTKIEK